MLAVSQMRGGGELRKWKFIQNGDFASDQTDPVPHEFNDIAGARSDGAGAGGVGIGITDEIDKSGRVNMSDAGYGEVGSSVRAKVGSSSNGHFCTPISLIFRQMKFPFFQLVLCQKYRQNLRM